MKAMQISIGIPVALLIMFAIATLPASKDKAVNLVAKESVKSLSKDRATTNTRKSKKIWVFRGVSSDHPGYRDALRGVAKPRGGTSNAIRHVMGFTDSYYVSTTKSLPVAYYFAITGNVVRCNGVINAIEIDLASPNVIDVELLPWLDIYAYEVEVLIRGGYEGAKVVKVGPGLKRKDVDKILRGKLFGNTLN